MAYEIQKCKVSPSQVAMKPQSVRRIQLDSGSRSYHAWRCEYPGCRSMLKSITANAVRAQKCRVRPGPIIAGAPRLDAAAPKGPRVTRTIFLLLAVRTGGCIRCSLLMAFHMAFLFIARLTRQLVVCILRAPSIVSCFSGLQS